MTRFAMTSGALPVLTVMLIAAMAGCRTPSAVDAGLDDQSGQVASIPPGAVPVSFQEIAGTRTPFSRHRESSRVVIRDAASWQAFWEGVVANVVPAPAAPAIDFERYTVIAAALGQRPSGGYAIHVDSVFVGNGTVYAAVKSVSPGLDCVVTAVITAPVIAVRIERVDGPVRFVEKAETMRCS